MLSLVYQRHKKLQVGVPTVGGRNIARIVDNCLGYIFVYFWDNLYIRRLPGPSPRPLEAFQLPFSEVFQYLRGENLPEEFPKKSVKIFIHPFSFFLVSFLSCNVYSAHRRLGKVGETQRNNYALTLTAYLNSAVVPTYEHEKP